MVRHVCDAKGIVDAGTLHTNPSRNSKGLLGETEQLIVDIAHAPITVMKPLEFLVCAMLTIDGNRDALSHIPHGKETVASLQTIFSLSEPRLDDFSERKSSWRYGHGWSWKLCW